jgi:hypothetical protein
MANKLEPQLVRVQLSVRDLQLEQLHSSLQRVLDLAGCPGCGLAGLDLNIRGPIEGPQPDPWLETALVREFAGAETFGPGVVDASLEAAIVIGS